MTSKRAVGRLLDRRPDWRRLPRADERARAVLLWVERFDAYWGNRFWVAMSDAPHELTMHEAIQFAGTRVEDMMNRRMK